MEVAQSESIDANPLQIEDAMAERLPEPAHLALATLTQDHRQSRLVRAALEQPSLGRLEPLPSHNHPLGKLPVGILTWPARDHDAAFRFQLRARGQSPPAA